MGQAAALDSGSVESPSAHTLAKLTRPRLYGAVARERLFHALDAGCERQAICVVGPPGAGKTTLVASYLDARAAPGIWYQVDTGDADVATFFYYLGQASAAHAGAGQRPLPVLTPEYLQDVPAFTRRFFRELFARLPDSAALVLDNCQEVPPESIFHDVVSCAAGEVPDRVTLIVISRADPPAHYARLIANERVELIDWEALRLTLAETRAIAKARGLVDEGIVSSMHSHSGGWATGLTLLIEQERRDLVRGNPAHEVTPDGIFDYFAGEIFDRADPDTQRFLIATSFLPRLTVSLAGALTGNGAAEEILEGLYRRHLFTHRRAGNEPVYQYHALFQNFLQHRARRLLGAQLERDTRVRAAQLTAQAGLTEEAYALYRAAASWEQAVQLLLDHARSLLDQGRGQTLRDWVAELPREVVDAQPWLTYWVGVSLIPVDQRTARAHLERAHCGFEALGDLSGQTLAASGVIQTVYFGWSEFQLHVRWIAALDGLLPQRPRFESREIELEVHSSLLVAMLHGQPGHPALPDCAERVLGLLECPLGINARVKAATFLLSYCTLANRLEIGRKLVARMEETVWDASVSPLNQVWWLGRLSYFLFQHGECVKAITALDRARELSEVHGLAGLRRSYSLFLDYRLLNLLAAGDAEGASACVAEVARLADQSRDMDVWHQLSTRLKHALATGDIETVIEHGPSLVARASATGMPFIEMLSLIIVGYAHAHKGLRAELDALMHRMRSLAAGTCFAYLEVEAELIEAYFELRHGERHQALALLRVALGSGRRHHYFYYCRFAPSIITTLCAEALAAGIDVTYVKEIVRSYALPAPERPLESWPWPVRIVTLGRFAVHVGGKALNFSGKVPRKPLKLLKVIVALGGVNVPRHTVEDILWPDEDGDSAQQALSVALVRLRRLLGNAKAVLFSDHKLSLNPALCWVDVLAFQHFVHRVEGELALAHGDRFEALFDTAQSLYGGPFLASESEEAWCLAPRLRLRTQFAAVIDKVGRRHESAGHWDRAVTCYQRGLQVNDLAEAFYLGLMRCYLELDRVADGLAAFRRLRQMLSEAFAVTPSKTAEELAGALRQKDSPA